MIKQTLQKMLQISLKIWILNKKNQFLLLIRTLNSGGKLILKIKKGKLQDVSFVTQKCIRQKHALKNQITLLMLPNLYPKLKTKQFVMKTFLNNAGLFSREISKPINEVLITVYYAKLIGKPLLGLLLGYQEQKHSISLLQWIFIILIKIFSTFI